MGGSRHSKNAGTMGSEAMTYAETRGRGFGTVQERLGKVCKISWCSFLAWRLQPDQALPAGLGWKLQ